VTSPVEWFEAEVLPRLSAETVFSRVSFKRSGRKLVGLCPLHSEKTPSFNVDPDALSWHCFGCGRGGGGPVKYLQELSGLTGMDAMKELARLAGVDEFQGRPPSEDELRKERTRDVFSVFFEVVREALAGGPPLASSRRTDHAGAKAQDYLLGRGFGEEDFGGFGFYPENVQDVLKPMEKAGYTAEELEASGLFVRREGCLHARDGRWAGRLVIPWRDHRGRLASFVARDLTEATDAGSKYLNLKGTKKDELGALGLDVALRSGGKEGLVLVEGPMDALLLQARVFGNVAALGGTATSPGTFEALARLGVRSVTLALDNDEAGRTGTRQAVENVHKGSNVPVVYVVDPVELGDAKDPDELVRKLGVDAFREVVTKAVHAYHYKAHDLIRRHKPGADWTDKGQDAAVDEALEFDARLPAEKAEELARHFWPIVEEATGADEDALFVRRDAARAKKAREAERQAYVALVKKTESMLAAPRVEIHEVRGFLQSEVDRLRVKDRGLRAEPVLSVAEELEAHEAYLEKFRGAEFMGLPQWTLPTLDRATRGLRGLMLLAAAPNVGKTALALQFGVDVVRKNQDACFLFVSLEMTRGDSLTRMKSRLAGLDWATVVFGSSRDRGRGRDTHFSAEELEQLRDAENELETIGPRIRILDEKNCPAPTLETVLFHVRDLKARTGTSKAFVVVDYLQVWPVPEEDSRRLRTDIDADKWRIGAMKTLRDETGDAIFVISEARKPAGTSGDSWGGALADVMGSARGTYTPDMVFLLRPFGAPDFDVWHRTKKGDQAGVDRLREDLKKRGLAYNILKVAKGRDGVLREDLKLTFHYKRSAFEEGVDEAEWKTLEGEEK